MASVMPHHHHHHRVECWSKFQGTMLKVPFLKWGKYIEVFPLLFANDVWPSRTIDLHKTTTSAHSVVHSSIKTAGNYSHNYCTMSSPNYVEQYLPPAIVEKLEAGAFQSLCTHLRDRSDEVQNIDLMTLSGFCRNCMAKVKTLLIISALNEVVS
jgi:hypothetical protein